MGKARKEKRKILFHKPIIPEKLKHEEPEIDLMIELFWSEFNDAGVFALIEFESMIHRAYDLGKLTAVSIYKKYLLENKLLPDEPTNN